MTYKTLEIEEITQTLLHVKLNRPKQLNTFSNEVWDEIFQLFTSLQTSNYRCVIVSGNGKLFSAGVDLNTFGSVSAADDADVSRKALSIYKMGKSWQASLTAIAKCNIPVLACVHSKVIGAGLELISACDVRYCTEDAEFILKEADAGLAADVGGLQRFPKLVGNDSTVREMTFTCRAMESAEALRIGLVTRVYGSKEKMLNEVIEIGKTICEKSPVPESSGKDIPIKKIFSDEMFSSLRYKLQKYFDKDNISEVAKIWFSDLRNKTVISEFLKDGEIGAKRLVSMPDRVSNTFTAKGKIYYRPSAINCHLGIFDSFESFWEEWLEFVFDEELKTYTRFQIISKDKYPKISEKESLISKELQLLYLAIFDSILVYELNHISENIRTWQTVRREICNSLNLHKSKRIINILEKEYTDRDFIFLQEVSPSLILALKMDLKHYTLYEPINPSKSNQNSVVLVSNNHGEYVDITSKAYDLFGSSSKVAPGDLIVLESKAKGRILASFHGDTNGLASKEVVSAVGQIAQDLSSSELFFGLDANVYDFSQGEKPGKQGFGDFVKGQSIESLGVDYTTFNARTFLQPQLNKAASKSEAKEKGDVNPKDFILIKRQGNSVKQGQTRKDNTGTRSPYLENSVFPTLSFPSDHAILSASFESTEHS
eukprot:maker-scaffold_2-augustus-gene-21.39-mRNA-1 protein AED:0.14 eAED:0.14 QI:0/0/0.33/1/0.5/0.66/3/84/655